MTSKEIDESRKRLLDGLERFHREVYPARKAAYQQVMKEGQKPHTLFITCADSRIDPEMITQSGPGEIFVSRNIGNIVPTYGEMMGGVSAIIEYAVAALQVPHVVVCGHTGCGAMVGLQHPDKLEKLPMVKSWLRNGEAALAVAETRQTGADEDAALEALIEENVLLQLHHLQTHPSVARRLAQGSLALSGWVYDIGNGTVNVFDEARRKFHPALPHQQAASGGLRE
jgi:carbonic anhydrase